MKLRRLVYVVCLSTVALNMYGMYPTGQMNTHYNKLWVMHFRNSIMQCEHDINNWRCWYNSVPLDIKQNHPQLKKLPQKITAFEEQIKNFEKHVRHYETAVLTSSGAKQNS
jgi:hypothetical protein